MVKVDISSGINAAGALMVGDVFAEPPDEHLDLPHDLLATDRTCTITAWAVNGDDEVISPVTVLKVRPVDTDQGAVTGFRDYRLSSTVALTDLVSTAYTVLKQAPPVPNGRAVGRPAASRTFDGAAAQTATRCGWPSSRREPGIGSASTLTTCCGWPPGRPAGEEGRGRGTRHGRVLRQDPGWARVEPLVASRPDRI